MFEVRRSLLVYLLVVLCAVGMTVLPIMAVAGPPGGETGTEAYSDAQAADNASLPEDRPYYKPEAFKGVPFNDARIEAMKESMPPELLPLSLLPEEKEETAEGQQAQPDGSGAADWIASQTNQADYAYPYNANPVNSVIDPSGNYHFLFGKGETKDVGGGQMETLYKYFHVVGKDGTWSDPVVVTKADFTKEETCNPVDFTVDADGCVHVLYTKHSWVKVTYPGPWDYYEPKDENLMYRYRSPDGTWSDPKKLTGFSGAYEVTTANSDFVGDRFYVAWYQEKNRSTAASEAYTTSVCYLEGIKGSWSKSKTLKEYKHTQGNDTKPLPTGWPGVSVLGMSGEVTVDYALSTFDWGDPKKCKDEIYGAIKAAPGAGAGDWSGPTLISESTGNWWRWPSFSLYNNFTGSYRLFIEEFKIDPHWAPVASSKPRSNMYMIKHDAKWQKQKQVTDLAAGYEVGAWSVWWSQSADEFHLSYGGEKYKWDGNWQMEASGLYAASGSDKFTNEKVWGLTTNCYVGSISTMWDPSYNTHTAFSVFKDDAGTLKDYKILYTTDGSSAGGSAFSTPERISKKSKYQKFSPIVNANAQGGVQVTWEERYFHPTDGYQQVGDLLSRYKDAGGWGSVVKINNNILDSWGGRTGFTPEQQCVFEDKEVVWHKDMGWASNFGYEKYFSQSSNGSWSTEMMSNLGQNLWSPEIYVDGSNRVHCAFDAGAFLYVFEQRTARPPSKIFYFAEGTTRTGSGGGFKEWICLQNPGDAAANVTITYMLGTGENKEQQVVVGGHARLTVDVNAAVGDNQDVSAMVASDQPIVAERPMYFDYSGATGPWTGGHDVVGSIVTSPTWFFAEGTTRPGFDEYLCLQNPTSADATVQITYMLGDGSTVDKEVKVDKKSRHTVVVKDDVGENQDVSVQLISDVAIVAERPMYFEYGGATGPWTGGHDVMGATWLQNLWYFAEGTTRANFDTYLCLGNPNPVAATVTITYIMGDGTTQPQELTIEATSRETVKVNDVIGPDKDVSMVINSSVPILAERPMYFNYDNDRPGGHVAMGALAPKNGWFFAEGTTRNDDSSGYFDEWLCLQNPGVLDANVKLSYMLGDGSVIEQSVVVPKNTRVTVSVNAAVGVGQDVSVSVWSDQGIIVERPMYFKYMSSPGVEWPGGHDVMGL